MSDSLTPNDPQNEPSPAVSKPDVTQLSPEELVAKSIAPVKKSYLLSPPARRTSTFTVVSETKSAAKNFSKDKKSKRQLKRERRQEQKSALHLCPEIAKTGDVSSCLYKDNCRFSHDVEAFKTQKPADLEGSCPFLSDVGACPYGLACRFAGTHKERVLGMAMNSTKKCSEVNGLSKDVQKLLWKNKMSSPKADATLKRLGLLGKGNKKKLDENEADLNRAHANCENAESVSATVDNVDHALEVDNGEDVLNEALNSDENRPFKKPKPLVGTELCSAEAGAALMDGNSKEVHKEIMTEVTDSMGMDTDISLRLHPREKKLIDFRDKLYLAPLTTVGNLPFRRVCKVLGADVTCGEMAMCTNLLQGQASEWALLRRHSSEDFFGVQICGAYPDTVTRAVELIEQECTIDFIDINMGCPIDIVVNKGAGSALLTKPMRMKGVIQAATGTVEKPITVKVRTGYFEGRNRIDSMIEDIGHWGAQAITIHGRSRQQRYSKLADWEYINQCAKKAPDTLQVLGNGDVFSFSDWNKHKSDCSELSTCMIARGALIKPWVFTEIKEQRHWDISSAERLNILKDYVHFGLQHWGSDTKGVETTRHFLLEWLSYTYRYVPVGLLDVIPQKLNWRPPSYFGRNELETLMASDHAADWVRISEILLGKVPDGFTFAPKHKSNAYDKAENG